MERRLTPQAPSHAVLDAPSEVDLLLTARGPADLDDRGCEKLIAAIVADALRDNPRNRTFFHSKYFHNLTGLDAKYVLEKLNKYVREEAKKNERKAARRPRHP